MRRYSAKETYNFIDPTDRSHPIATRGLGRSLEGWGYACNFCVPCCAQN